MGGNCCSTERFYAEEGIAGNSRDAPTDVRKKQSFEAEGEDDEDDDEDDDTSTTSSTSEPEKLPGIRRALALAADGTFQLDIENVRRNGPHEDMDSVSFRGKFVAKRQYQKIKPDEDPKDYEFKSVKIFGRHSYRNVGVDSAPTLYNWFLLEDGTEAAGSGPVSPSKPGSPSKGSIKSRKNSAYPREQKAEIYTLDQSAAHANLGKHGPTKAGHGSHLDMFWCSRVPREVFNFKGHREDDQITFVHIEPLCQMVNNAISIRLEEREVQLNVGDGPQLSQRQLPDRSCILSGF